MKNSKPKKMIFDNFKDLHTHMQSRNDKVGSQVWDDRQKYEYPEVNNGESKTAS